jgi:hypothetical protein
MPGTTSTGTTGTGTSMPSGTDTSVTGTGGTGTGGTGTGTGTVTGTGGTGDLTGGTGGVTGTPMGPKGIGVNAAPDPMGASGGRSTGTDLSGGVGSPSGVAPPPLGGRAAADSGAIGNAPSTMMGEGRGPETSSMTAGGDLSRGADVSGSTGPRLDATGQVTTGMSTGVSSATGSAQAGTRDVTNQTTDAEYKAQNSDGAVNSAMGSQARSAVVDGNVQSSEASSYQTKANMYGTAEGRANLELSKEESLKAGARSDAEHRAGLDDASTTQGRINDERYKATDQYYEGEAKVDQARAIERDPTGSAKRSAYDATVREANEKAPVSTYEAEGKVSEASRVVHDPAAAGEAQVKSKVDIEVDAKIRGSDPTKK